MDTLAILFFVVLGLGVYFIPSIIAFCKGHQSKLGIFFLNLLLGWSLLGWIVSFVWAFIKPTQIVVNNNSSYSVAEEIQKLSDLKEQGIISEPEYVTRKQKILENA